jgi:hypothetical protein
MSSGLDRVATPLALGAVMALGLSAGAMLTEQMLFVPYWRSLPAADFLRWFGDNEPRLVAFFGPLQAASALLTVAAAALYAMRRRPGRGLLGVAALLALAVLGFYSVYFRAVNASFVAGTIPIEAVAEELTRWSAWQWLRIASGVLAFAAALVAATRSTSPRIQRDQPVTVRS